jgi:hypothetical protein
VRAAPATRADAHRLQPLFHTRRMKGRLSLSVIR